MSNQVALSAIVIYNAQAKNQILSQTLASLTRAKQIILHDVGIEPIADFAAVRNEALKKAQEDYALFIDADEVLTAGSWSELEKIVKRAEADLVSLVRSDVFYGRELKAGEAGGQRVIRLGRKTKLHFRRSVHEVAEVNAGDQIVASQIKLKHYSHANLTEFLTKITYYSRLEAQARAEQNRVWLVVAMITFPPAKFFWNLVPRRGYQDGVRGIVYALMMSLHSLFVRVHGWELLGGRGLRSGKMVR